MAFQTKIENSIVLGENMDIIKETQNIMPQVIKWRRELHQIPEVGFELQQTAAYVKNALTELGIPFLDNQGCECGIVGIIKGNKAGKVLALRSDMDALPILEETGLPFASTNGNMHACGHDAHMAILLGVAKLLMENRDKIEGEVRLIFQPAEELGTGAEKMIAAGVLDGVDEIIGSHVGGLVENAENGELLFRKGGIMATMDQFKILVKGKGAHGSAPERSIDPIVVASEIVGALQNIVSREVCPTDPCVISVCKFHSGTAFNIIPDTAELEGTTRVFDEKLRDFIEKRIGEVAESVASGLRAAITYEYLRKPPPLVTDDEITEKVYMCSKQLYPDNVRMLDKGIMGGEDFAHYAKVVPATYFFLKNLLPIDGVKYSNHNAKFALDESVMDRLVAVIAAYTLGDVAN